MMDIVKCSSSLTPLGGSKTSTYLCNKSTFCIVIMTHERITLAKHQAAGAFTPP